LAAPTPHAERYLRVDGLGIQSARRGADHVISLEGDLEMANAAAVQAELSQVEAGDCDQIVLDLRRLSFLDSTGISVLIGAHERAAASGRPLALLVGDGPVHRVLDVCGALSILPTKAAA
jgi:anti-anti-sigma factor